MRDSLYDSLVTFTDVWRSNAGAQG
jgi:hypothetical protein